MKSHCVVERSIRKNRTESKMGVSATTVAAARTVHSSAIFFLVVRFSFHWQQCKSMADLIEYDNVVADYCRLNQMLMQYFRSGQME